MAESERLYQLSYDSQKWLFSQYTAQVHYDDVSTVVRAIADTVCQMKYDIVCDAGLYREHREKMLEIPRAHGHEVIEINLEADWETLTTRFAKRVADATEKGTRLANTSTERFKELYNIYEAEKNLSAVTLRTDEQDIDAVFRKVQEIISR